MIMTRKQFLSLQVGQTIYMEKTGKPRLVTSTGKGAIQLDGRVTYSVGDRKLFSTQPKKNHEGGTSYNQS